MNNSTAVKNEFDKLRLNEKVFDVAVVGGGVIGGLILRQITKYQLSCVLLEKANDVCMGQSKANSGIVHAGYDAKSGTLKAKFNVLGNKMMPAVASQLGVKYKNNGSLVVAFSNEDMQTLETLLQRGRENGVEGLEILNREQLVEKEKNISDDAIGALFAPTGGIICPYDLTISAIGNAMDNGANLYTSFEVSQIQSCEDGFILTSLSGQKVLAKTVVNCAGIASEKVANLIGDYSFKMGARKGEYILLDKNQFVNSTLFFTPTEKGKGILVTQTVDGNVLLGPTSKEIENSAPETDADGLNFIIEKAKSMCKNLPLQDTITSFAGVRAYCDRHDFIIEKSQADNRFINVAGIESPGLTSAPAIAEYVVNDLIGSLLPLNINQNFNGERNKEYFFRNLTAQEKTQVILNNPSYGKLVCKCENLSEGEIVTAIKTNPPATDIDAIKRRTRAGMGRCQGGFCQPYVAEILARELNIPLEKVTKKGKGSEILSGVSK